MGDLPCAVTAGLRPSSREAEGWLYLAAGIGVKAAGAVAALAAGVDRIWPLRDEPRMVGGGKVTIEFVVALLAFLGANIFCARDIRQ